MAAADASLPRFPVDFKTALLSHLPEGMAAPADDAIARMELHARLLLRWGRLTSLTSITDPVEIVRRHFCESLACLAWIPAGGSILDLGTGAGFPGLPIQVVRESLGQGGPLILVESTGRKAEFLRAVIGDAGVKNTSVIEKHARTESDLANSAPIFPVDAFVARAIPDPSAWAMRTARLVSDRGRGLFFVGEDARREIVSRLADKGLSIAANVLLPGSRASWLLVLERSA